MVIKKLKERIKSLNGNIKEDKIKQELEEIETTNIELDHRVTKLIAENELLKQTYKRLYDSVKSSRIRSKEQCDDLIKQVNLKSAKNSDLNASLQEQVLDITALKYNLRKLKGKVLVDKAVILHPIDPEMLKVDIAPLAPKLRNNRTAHSDYLKHTQEETANIKEIVKHERSLNPLNTSLDYACKYTKRIQELLIIIRQTCPCINNLGVNLSTSASRSQPSGNTKKDKIQKTPSSSKKNKIEAHPRNVRSSLRNKNCVVKTKNTAHVQNSKSNVNFDLQCVTCNGSLFSDNYYLCVLEFINNVNARVKSKSVKKTVKRKIWKPTGKVVQIVLWYLDSGCSKHMTEDRSQLTNFVDKFLGTVKFSNDHVEKIMGYGDYHIGNVTILRVYFIDRLGHNLFSIGQFCDLDLEVVFRQHTCLIRNLEGVDLLFGSQGNNLYTLSLGDMMMSSLVCLFSKASKTKSWLWHRRLSHLNFGAINNLARQGLVRGLSKLKFQKDHLCSACAMGKSKKKSHKPKSEDTNQEKLYLLHMDLCGPMRVKSVNGKKYILVIVNDYSRFTWVKCLSSKDEALDFIIKFLKMIQVDISHETSVARSPQQNDVVERRSRTLIKAARTMLIYARASLFLWAEAVATACFTQNRLIIRLHHGKTPYELLHDKLPDLSYFHVFGALCYPTNDSENLGKLQPKADIAMASKQSSSGLALHEMTHATISSGLVPKPTSLTPVDHPAPEVIALIAEVVASEPAESTGSPSSTTVDQDTPSPSKSQTTPETQPPVTPNNVEEDNHDIEITHMVNDSFFVMLIPEIEAMQEELNEFERLEVWELIPRPDKVMVITLKWIYIVKLDELGEAIRIFLAFAAHKKMVVYQMDVKTAFLNGSVDPTLFIHRNGNDLLLVQIYVDDIIFTVSTPELCDLFAKIMCLKFKMSMMGKISFFFGLQISQSPRGIFINQSKYALESLKKYGFESCDPMDTPMVEKSKLDEDKEGKAVDPSHYHGMIGTLFYLTASRPDLQFAICMCAQYQARPTEKHLHTVKRIFRYLRGTVNRGLWYPKDSTIALTAFADADHAGCQDTRCSTFGSLSKHIDIRYHFIKEHVENGVNELYFVNTEYQLADIFTKALGRERIEFLINKLGMRSFTPETLQQLTDEVYE
nr:hypothetical protein [Tanacetum cinerariifolium]